jgi:hypothetical protein
MKHRSQIRRAARQPRPQQKRPFFPATTGVEHSFFSGQTPGIQREMEVDPSGRLTGNYVFRPGTGGLGLSFFQQLQQQIADGSLSDDEINLLRAHALRTQGSVTHAERLIMAAVLNPLNIRLVQGARGAQFTLAVASITGANRDYVANVGRESFPEGIALLVLQAMIAKFRLNPARSEELLAEASEQATRDILTHAGPQFQGQAAQLIAFIQAHSIPAYLVLNAMLQAASDSSAGDKVFSGIAYATASQAGLPQASSLASGQLHVDALIPRAFDQMLGSGFDAMYTPVALTDVTKGDTLYLKTSLDIGNVAHRSLIVHELTHAAEDHAATPGTTVPVLDFEARAYRAQVRYTMDQILTANAADQPQMVRDAAVMANIHRLFPWSFLAVTKRDQARYEAVVRRILTTPPSAVTNAQITAVLAMSQADIDTRARNEINTVPGYAAAPPARLDGPAGESILDLVN